MDCDCRTVSGEKLKEALTQSFMLLPEYVDGMYTKLQKTRNQISQYRSGYSRSDVESFIVEELLDEEMRIISLMQMSGSVDTILAACCPYDTTGKGPPDTSSGACYTEQDFIMRTGRVPKYENSEYVLDDAMVIRFVEKILVGKHSLKVNFRAGISIEINE